MIEHVPTPPFATKPNTDSSTRGHDEIHLGAKLVVCKRCKRKRGRRWDFACPSVTGEARGLYG